MSTDPDRLRLAHWILERNLHWIAAAEVKTGVIVAIDTAMLGALAAAYTAVAQHVAWANLATTVAAACLLLGVFCCAMVVLPRVTGPSTSFIFFGCIVKNSSADYADSFRRASVEKLLDDCLAQVHRNAEIANEKFGWVKAGMWWSFIAMLPWIGAIAVLTNWR